FRTYAMAVVGTIGAAVLAFHQVRDISRLVQKFHDPAYATLSRDELIQIGREELGSKLVPTYLNKVCVSLMNPFVFAFFGTTRQAGDMYLQGLKRFMKSMGAKGEVLDKVSEVWKEIICLCWGFHDTLAPAPFQTKSSLIAPNKLLLSPQHPPQLSVRTRPRIGQSTIDTRFHSNTAVSSALTHPTSTISIPVSQAGTGRAPSNSFENATTVVRVSRDRDGDQRGRVKEKEKQKKGIKGMGKGKGSGRRKSGEMERDAVGGVSQYQISVQVLRLSDEVPASTTDP
ncbi:hypothetical protein HK102_009503, partial [Quaeritorhiza haematococci]